MSHIFLNDINVAYVNTRVVDAMPPSIGDDELGFSDALGCFDTVVDTLGDEADLRKVKDFDDGIDRVFGYAGVSEKLKKENSCQRLVHVLVC
jgi:hypothetical protein